MSVSGEAGDSLELVRITKAPFAPATSTRHADAERCCDTGREAGNAASGGGAQRTGGNDSVAAGQ